MAASRQGNWAKIENGAFVNMRKPVSFLRADEHLEIILAYWPGGSQEWVTWLYNREDGGCTGGHYFDTRKQAVEDFKDRGNIKLVEHNQEPVEDLPPGNWEKVSKPPVLGHDQAGMLRVVKERGSWYRSSGWTWGTLSLSGRVIKSLEKKGLVAPRTAEIAGRQRVVYKLTDRAEELFERKTGSNYWHYKDGAIQEIKRPSR